MSLQNYTMQLSGRLLDWINHSKKSRALRKWIKRYTSKFRRRNPERSHATSGWVD